MSASVQWDTGYSLLIIAGFAVWIGVPVLNANFNTAIMTATHSVPVFGVQQLNVIIGGGLAGIGVLSYIGFRL